MAPMPRPALLLLLLVLSCFGCKPAPVEIDQARFNTEFERRAQAAVTKPEVEKSFDVLINGTFAEPSVSQAGQGLLSALGADPTLKLGFDAVLAKLATHPVMKQLALRLVRENPGASPDKIGELAGLRISGITD